MAEVKESGTISTRICVQRLGIPSATAKRHIAELVAAGVLEKEGTGRSTRYRLIEPKASCFNVMRADLNHKMEEKVATERNKYTIALVVSRGRGKFRRKHAEKPADFCSRVRGWTMCIIGFGVGKYPEVVSYRSPG